MDLLKIEESNALYQSIRSKTTMGLEIGSLIAGAYGAAKRVVAINRFAKASFNFSKLGRLTHTARSEFSASSSLNRIRLKNRLISQEISGGHAFLNRGEFPGWIRTHRQFTEHIEHVINHPTEMKELRNGRTSFWHQETGAVIIRNPSALDGGTAFQALEGIKYFEMLR